LDYFSQEVPTPGTLPRDARVFPIRFGRKDAPLTTNGHLDALPLEEWVDLGNNAGLALDGQWLLVDIDRPDCLDAKRLERKLDAEEPTWSQRSRRGRHWLYRLPPGYRVGNAKLKDDSGVPFGDLKTRGYVMAPGSVVAGHRYEHCGLTEPISLPDWLADLHAQAAASTSSFLGGEAAGRDSIPIGEQHAFAVSLAGFLRRHGLSASAMDSAFSTGLQRLFTEQIPGRPWLPADYAAIFRDAESRWAPELQGDAIGLPEGWQSGETTSLVGPPERWWVPGFLPMNELTMIYGRGGAGKSTLASWLAAEVTRKGGTFGVISVEEPFRRFLRRAVLGGADRTKLFGYERAASLQLPRDAVSLLGAIRWMGLDTIYIDSIASHMDATSGLNVAERTRRSLSPLAEFAQAEGVTIICNFHENKVGEPGGSVEMLNVARHVLHVTRDSGRPLRVRVKKTNMEEPPHALQFVADDREVVDPQTGEVQERVREDGSTEVAHTIVLRAIEPIPNDALHVEDVMGTELPAPTPTQQREDQAFALLAADPNISVKSLAEHLGCAYNTALKIHQKIRLAVAVE
jgi:energy-coupling factor transporter ATP-binding protein EcfA2